MMRRALAHVAVAVGSATLAGASACTYDFDAASAEFGARAASATASSSASSGSGGTGGGGGAAPACREIGEPDPVNPGGDLGPTAPFTTWYWPRVDGGISSLEWTLNVDFEPRNDGYFWAHQFAFEGAGDAVALVGLQQNGAYVEEPPDGPIDVTKMALLSVSTDVLSGEAGVPAPDGVAIPTFEGGPGWSIHVRYAWEPCRDLRFRLAYIEEDAAGDRWFGAWIVDAASGDETMIGRVLVPRAWGFLQWWSRYFSLRFGYDQLVSCDVQEHASAVFGDPTANGGRVTPDARANEFEDPPHCANSRFTDLGDATRQEMGVPPP